MIVMRGHTESGKRGEEGAALAPRPPPQRVATICHATNYHEKTTLLSSDDEFQWINEDKSHVKLETYRSPNSMQKFIFFNLNNIFIRSYYNIWLWNSPLFSVNFLNTKLNK